MLLGRDQDLTALVTRLRDNQTPLTLTGPLGVGKSALADAACRLLQPSAPDRHHIDFARDGSHAVATMDQLLLHRAASRQTVVVLDNVDGFRPIVRQWLNGLQVEDNGAKPTVIVTARARVGFDRECVAYLRPLPVLDSINLFRRVAVAQGRRDQDWDPVVLTRLVRQLDCLPLAIELCARHAVTTPLLDLEAALSRSRTWLTNPAVECRPEHASWLAAITQGLNEIPAHTRDFLTSLARFDERFTFQDIKAAQDQNHEPHTHQALPHLTLLHEQGLLNFDAASESYTLLSCVKTHVREVAPVNEEQALSFVRFLRTGAQHAVHLGSEQHAAWLIRHRFSLLTTAERFPDSTTDAMMLALARAAAWCGPIERTLLALQRAWNSSFLAGLTPVMRGSLLQAQAKLHERLGHLDVAHEHYLRALDCATSPTSLKSAETRSAYVEFRVSLLTDLGTLHRQRGSDGAQACYAEALSLFDDPCLRTGRARLWATLATQATERHALEEASHLFERALQAARDEGSLLVEGAVLSNRGVLRQEQGRHQDAQIDFLEARNVHHQLGHQRFEAIAEFDLGCLALEEGQCSLAQGHLQSAVALASDVEDRSQVALGLTLLATSVTLHQPNVIRAQISQARQWLADAATMFERIGNPYLLAAHRVHNAQLAVHAARNALLEGNLRGHAEQLRAAEDALQQLDSLTSDEVRFAQRLLRKSVAACTDLPNAVLVAGDGTWLHKPPHERVTLKSDSPQRRVLRALVNQYTHSPTRPLAAELLVRQAWPAENLNLKSAMNRLHVALTSLRKSGLHDHLQHTANGYLLLNALPQ
jgi:tetratricopeptide (TPR) repeat protein